MDYHFIFEDAPHRFAHAATLVETKEGLLAAWFGGLEEGSPDTGIWLARFQDGEWGDHRAVALGGEAEGVPCWNPVLHRAADCLFLFYRIGPSPWAWHSRLLLSQDEGRTWEAAGPLPEGYLGPIKNKPLEVGEDLLLCPSSTEHEGWRAHVERFSLSRRAWMDLAPLGDPLELGAIQPTLLSWPDGRLQALCRTRKRVVGESWSHDAGETWSDLRRTEMANPNSGLDGVVLRNGLGVLVNNPSSRERSPLQILLSDDGEQWRTGPLLEAGPGEYSYPAIIQTGEGRVHVAYTYNRLDIRHVVLEADELR